MSTWCSTILESPKSANNTREKFNETSLFSAFIRWQSTSVIQNQMDSFVFVSDDGGMKKGTSHLGEETEK